MKSLFWSIVFTLALSWCSFLGADAADQCPSDRTGKSVVCYYASWSYYREEVGHFNISHIDVNLCTHIVYTFAGLDFESKIGTLDYNYDVTKGGYNYFTSLKYENPCIKVMLAIGGWNEGSRKYSIMAYTPESREKFADSVIRFLAAYNFDGLDLDWEYPTKRGGIADDRDNFTELLKLLREKFTPWGYLLSVAVPISASDVVSAYDIASMNKYLDFMSIMAYDYTATDSKTTGLISPISEVKKGIDTILNNGFPAEKLVLGFASYARTFTLLDASDNGVGAPTDLIGESGEFTKEPGFLSYYELQMELEGMPYSKKKQDGNCYGSFDKNWLTYDDDETYSDKVNLACSKNLKGVMLWTIDTDDFLGEYDAPYPVLTILNLIHDC